MENICNELKSHGYHVIKIAQMTSRKDGRLLPLFQVQIDRNENSKKIIELQSIFKIRVEIDKYRPPPPKKKRQFNVGIARGSIILSLSASLTRNALDMEKFIVLHNVLEKQKTRKPH